MIRYRIAMIISTFFLLGKIPFAPGTAGSLGGVLLLFMIGNVSVYAYILLVMGLCVLGWWSVLVSLEKANTPDPKYIVIDEVVGQAIATAPLIGAEPQNAWWWYCLSFLLFRLFDIWKPWPISWVDRLTASKHISRSGQTACIICDDVLAGLAAGICLYFSMQHF
ncbi:MAG: phosphatidylglycerophosphatase A [Holosporales bacterium]|jgi:phosphatidylglycerophosphatase A|nr:phosphatidylglycerophosphatase A [Holosporales bacterium]